MCVKLVLQVIGVILPTQAVWLDDTNAIAHSSEINPVNDALCNIEFPAYQKGIKGMNHASAGP